MESELTISVALFALYLVLGSSIQTAVITTGPAIHGFDSATQSNPVIGQTTIGPGFEASVAVNPADPSNVIATGGAGMGVGADNFAVAQVSFDSGITWKNVSSSFAYVSSIAKNTWGFIDRVATFDVAGDAYVGTIDNGTMDWLFKSTDGGNSWSLTNPFLKLNDDLLDFATGATVHPCAPGLSGPRDLPAVLADSSATSPDQNNVYVYVRTGAQVGPTGCTYGVAFERSTDGGRTWGSGLWLGPNGVDFLGPFESDFALSDNRGMSVAPDGTLLLAGVGLCHTLSGSVSNVLVLESTDGGISFRELCVNASLDVFDVEAVATSARDVYVLIFGSNATEAHLHLHSLVSHDGGNSWSALSRIDDVTFPDTQHVAFGGLPMWDLSLSQQTGRLDVTWLDWRNNGGNYFVADLYYSYSYDGISWQTNIRLTPQGPYYYRVSPGNDFIWVASRGPTAYIVASMGATSCSISCTDTNLHTRFVTVTFPSPSISVSEFVTDPSFMPLPRDVQGNPTVSVFLVGSVLRTSAPRHILAWVNVTNTGSTVLGSLVLKETLPADWVVSPQQISGESAIHVYHANTTDLSTNPEITGALTTIATATNPETLEVSITNFTATSITHPLMPGQSILVSVQLGYALVKTIQPSQSYPRTYNATASCAAWVGPSESGMEASATDTNTFIAYAKTLGH